MFVSQSPAIGAIEKLGYVAEYIPSASYVGGDRTLWEDWLEHELDLLIDDYDPSIVVFDGNHLYPGLIRAAALTNPPLGSGRWPAQGQAPAGRIFHGLY